MSTLSFSDLTEVSDLDKFIKFLRSYSPPVRKFRTFGTVGEIVDLYFYDHAGKNKMKLSW